MSGFANACSGSGRRCFGCAGRCNVTSRRAVERIGPPTVNVAPIRKGCGSGWGCRAKGSRRRCMTNFWSALSRNRSATIPFGRRQHRASVGVTGQMPLGDRWEPGRETQSLAEPLLKHVGQAVDVATGIPAGVGGYAHGHRTQTDAGHFVAIVIDGRRQVHLWLAESRRPAGRCRRGQAPGSPRAVHV